MGSFSGMIPVRKFTDIVNDRFHDDPHGARTLDWHSILLENGYHCVGIPGTQYWTATHAWLKKNVDAREYVWVGYNFYFTHQKDAVLFALKWA